MLRLGGKKGALLGILTILWKYSDVDNPLTHEAIIDKLSTDYDIQMARNAVGSSIKLLREMGYDIITENLKGSYLCNRLFSDTELVLLIDAVLSSRYIPENTAKELMDKLTDRSTVYFKKKQPHIYLLKEWDHQRNREFTFNLEQINEAIEKGNKISFIYNKFGINGELQPGKKHTVNPYRIICARGQYYLLCSAFNYDSLRHYRLDKITKLEISKETAKPIEQITGYNHGIDIAKYALEHNFMYGGKVECVKLKISADMMGAIFDSFGSDARMCEIPNDKEHIEVTVKGALEGMCLWAMQYAGVCEVLEPAELRNKVKLQLEEAIKKYN